MKGHIHSLCNECTHKFLNNPLCILFKDPVAFDNRELDEEYRRRIPKPMDLTTLQANLKDRDHYKDPEEWANDFRLIFDNAMTFYQPKTELYVLAAHLKQKFEKFYSKLKYLTPSTYVQRATQLYANYLEILTHPPQNASFNVDLPLIENIGHGFEETSLELLTDKLNKISNPERFEELHKIIQNKPNDNQDSVVDVGSLPQETIKKLWEFVRKSEVKS
ncbi:hypothetical protein M9Y10_002344 [Tritrichomonas musculus]|uniref:Bromo domain-containing protein n=1 Tax=Tritrichomonas musculus TaxID=1915356 RepID=A0ABR2LAK0_9EUKA